METTKIEQLFREMIRYDGGDPHRIQHFIKVHSFSKRIALPEGLDEKTLFTLEAAAIVHDIGIKAAMEQLGSCTGPDQERLGPPIAREMLQKLGYPEDVTERVCYLVGHHHTYTDIDGADYQILVEADFLVNMFEGRMSPEGIAATYKKLFRTKAGREICRVMFGLDEIPEQLTEET